VVTAHIRTAIPPPPNTVKAPVNQPLNRKAVFSQMGRVTKDAAADAERLLHRKLAKLNGKVLIHSQRTDQQVAMDWSGVRLGHSAAPNLCSTKPSGPLGAISDFVAHHVERLGRDADGWVGSDGVRKRMRLGQLPGPHLHGQRICNLHIQQDGVQGQGHQQGDGVLLGVVPEEADNDSRVIHPWSPHRGRRAKSEARRALGVHPGAASLRPVVQLGNLVTYLPANRSANIRPVRNTHQLEDAPLRESAPRPILHDSGLPEASAQAPTGYAVRVSPTQDPDTTAGEGARGASGGAAMA
jgi:hypothetical protein